MRYLSSCVQYAARRISRMNFLRKILPFSIQNFLWNSFLKSKGEKLRKEIIRYFGNQNDNQTGNIRKSIDFLKKTRNGFYSVDFLKIWLHEDEKGRICFDFNGAKLPNISQDMVIMSEMCTVFQDTFLFHCLLNDNYDKELVERFDPFMPEGPYGYTTGDFDVAVKENNVVIDAGAWIGDFSAYAAEKGAAVYAFEPTDMLFEALKKTAVLNNDKITVIKKGLGNTEGNIEITVNCHHSGASSLFAATNNKNSKKEIISITTLDAFVKSQSIQKIDFIKADIEGAERDLLKGAKMVLKEFSPKLAICTYHNPDDPQVLEKIILDANPRYRIIHTREKLFGMVI